MFNTGPLESILIIMHIINIGINNIIIKIVQIVKSKNLFNLVAFLLRQILLICTLKNILLKK